MHSQLQDQLKVNRFTFSGSFTSSGRTLLCIELEAGWTSQSIQTWGQKNIPTLAKLKFWFSNEPITLLAEILQTGVLEYSCRFLEKFCSKICLLLQTGASHALYQPVIQTDGQLAAVVELWRGDPFHEEDEEIASSYLVWGGIALHYAQLYLSMNKQRKLNDFLLAVVK
jgi:hypothetical protein